jgi:hypothetical protein
MSCSVLREDRLEGLRAMADLEDRHADAGQGDQVALRSSRTGTGKNCGTGGEIKEAMGRGGH